MDLPPDNLLSPENLRKLREVDPNETPPRTAFIRGQFLRGPIPMSWLEKAASLPGKAPLAVALVIRYEAGRQPNPGPIKLTNPLVARLGVRRKAKYSALTALEEAGLVQVVRLPRKSPLISIVEVDP